MTYSLHCQDMDDEVFEELDDALEAGDAIWSHMTEKEQMACEILEVWDDDADASKGPEYNWPAEGPRGSWEITPHPDALMVEAPSGESYIVPCRTNEDVWDALAAYDNDHGTRLWDWVSPHNVDMKRHDDDLLLGDDMRWVFADCDVVLDSDSLDFEITMDGSQGKRLMIVPGFHVYDDVKALDEGSSPIRDQWEDGNGNTVCYDNGQPVARTPKEAIDERMPALIMRFSLSPREAQAIILSDMGMGPQEIADTLGRMLGTSMTRQSITNALRKARIKMAIDKEE